MFDKNSYCEEFFKWTFNLRRKICKFSAFFGATYMDGMTGDTQLLCWISKGDVTRIAYATFHAFELYKCGLAVYDFILVLGIRISNAVVDTDWELFNYF